MHSTFTTGLRSLLLLALLLPLGCGNEDDNFNDLDMIENEVALEKSTTATHTYNLPFFSGQSYVATTYSGHYAWDFNLSGTSGNGDCGEAVVATTSGWVIDAVNNCDGCTSGTGNRVVIDHDADSNTSSYYHLQTVFVMKGQWVQRGQTIGTMGNNGNTWTNGQQMCHIHYEVKSSNGSSITPSVQFIYSRGGQKTTSTLSSGSTYTSMNQGTIDAAYSENGGSGKLGSQTTTLSSDVDSEGYAIYYTGGSYGSCSIYYQALGCIGGDFCPTRNNSTRAWLVRSGFYNEYFNCGGPSFCWLGFPTGNEYSVSGGAKQTFEYGYMLYSSSTGKITLNSY